jgi:hypothetical protein
MRRCAVAALVVACALGCSRGAKSQEEAARRLAEAVRQGNTAAVYDVVDQETRWSIDSVWKYHQQCLAAIEESYPTDAQARESRRFIDAASARDFLKGHEERYHELAGLAPRVGQLGAADFARDQRGQWGYTGLRALWEDAKQRASHDLETVRASAAAYKQAAR